MEEQDLKNRFAYHSPRGGRPSKYEVIRQRAHGFALDINQLAPDSREKSLAITALEEAVMWANAAIARHPEE